MTPQISKTLLYEQYAFADPSYLSNAVLIAGVDQGRSGDNAYTYGDPACDYIVKNSVIANCGYSTFFALGGSYRFVHCTLDNHWHASTTARKTGSIQVGNYQMDNEYNVYYYPFNMEMNNCIITGSLENEFVTGFDGGADSTFIFNNCLLKSNRFAHSTSGFNHCIFNEEPLFVDVNRNDFHIDSIASPVIGTGNPLYGNEIPHDLDGVSRIGIPDMGAYQYVPKN